MCGELAKDDDEGVKFLGSSPRVWGTLRNRLVETTKLRFIPACVGNSASWSGPRTSETVHPRVCGELVLIAPTAGYIYGSSPRVWGTQPKGSYYKYCGRFIPACVGNSSPRRPWTWRWTVHPRVCGELPRVSRRKRVFFGSSPRVWGTQHAAGAVGSLFRFIPACVGNS